MRYDGIMRAYIILNQNAFECTTVEQSDNKQEVLLRILSINPIY